MSAGRYDMTIEQGATFRDELTITDGGEPLDLTGYSARMHIRRTVAEATTILELTTANGRLTLGGAAGTITRELSASVTAALSFVVAVYDLEIESPSGVVTRLLYGTVRLSREVTR